MMRNSNVFIFLFWKYVFLSETAMQVDLIKRNWKNVLELGDGGGGGGDGSVS